MVGAIDSVTGLGTQASTAAKGLADNYTTFITLLTAQLQNQDPLKPTDSNQFIQQLTSFSSVEQQIRASDQLEKLVALQQGAATSTAVGYLGKTVTLDSATTTLAEGGSSSWNYSLPTAGAETKISIKNSAGQTVFTTTGDVSAGPHTFTWNGKSNAGDAQAAGNYSIVVESKAQDGTAIPTNVNVKAKINAVDLSSGTPMVETDVGAYALEKVLRIIA